MRRKIFLFTFLFLASFLLFKKEVKAETLIGHCLCETECKAFTYKDDAELKNAQAYCASNSCKSKHQFLSGGCETFKAHCVCKSGCVDKTYTNETELKVGQDFCSSKDCESSGTLIEGACAAPPSASASTPDKKDISMVKLENPLNLSTDVKVIVGTIIKGLLGIMGALSLLMVVHGATGWILAAGNAEKVSASSKQMLWAVLGAVLTAASYIILSGIMKFF